MSERLENLVRARLLVAALGERSPQPWWRSQATTEVSGRWLERLFPRTAHRAALEVAGRAALAVHDSRLGDTAVYHLFRLPGSMESSILDLLSEGKPNLEEVLAAVAKGEAQGQLAALAANEPLDALTGPVNCGKVSSLQRGRGLQRVCAAYVAAFEANVQVFPYLEPDGV